MSKLDKLIARFLSHPKDFTYDELKKILTAFGYIEFTKGKTSGSRVAFIQPETKHIIRLHKPHPGKILKAYQVNLVADELKKLNLL